MGLDRLDSPAHSVDPQFGTLDFLSGWTARGYPNLRGYAWYRLRILVQDRGQPVWLSMPINVDDAYQVFANGQYLGQFGSFGPRLSNTVASAAQGMGVLDPRVSVWAGEFWANSIFIPAQQLFWTVFWWRWFGLESRWIPRASAALTVLNILILFFFESPLLGFSFASQSLLRASSAAIAWILSALGILLVVVLVEGFRRDRTAALLATAPIVLLEISNFYVTSLVIFHISPELYLGPVGIQYHDLAGIGIVLIVSILSLRRFLANRDRELTEREAVARDLEQARQLQQGVLVAERIQSKFCTVPVEYHPAQTVGGDFFQTLTHADGSLTAIIGDVSGKGISAAMLVAVLAGAARARARETSDPTVILEELNRQIMGRAGGHFATCLAAALDADGTLRLANAGHLPPYRNGREVKLEGSLPLGLADRLEPAVLVLQLEPGEVLTFLTDGIVEARNAQGELFGFDRAATIATRPAEEIARAAQSFGQEDDITVLSLSFAPVVVEHAWVAPMPSVLGGLVRATDGPEKVSGLGGSNESGFGFLPPSLHRAIRLVVDFATVKARYRAMLADRVTVNLRREKCASNPAARGSSHRGHFELTVNRGSLRFGCLFPGFPCRAPCLEVASDWPSI